MDRRVIDSSGSGGTIKPPGPVVATLASSLRTPSRPVPLGTCCRGRAPTDRLRPGEPPASGPGLRGGEHVTQGAGAVSYTKLSKLKPKRVCPCGAAASRRETSSRRHVRLPGYARCGRFASPREVSHWEVR